MEAEGARTIPRSRLAGRVRKALDSGGVILTAAGGCGKTTILDQVLADSSRPVVWISCSDTERAPGALLMRIVNAIAGAAPGASDTLAERLATAPERVDALAATHELMGDLSRLLVEPLVLVVDDAEHLDGADDSLRLLGELIRAEVPYLHVAVASRRPLDLRVAKPLADGRLTALGAADLAFDAEECAALLGARAKIDPSPEQVNEVMEATEGWPLGIALAAGMLERAEPGADGGRKLGNLGAAPDLRSYLAEELLDSLDPELREAAIASSVTRTVTPEVQGALDLPADLGDRIARAGLMVRRVGEDRAFAYHPLLREFLLERLREGGGETEWRRVNAAVAPAVAEQGDEIGAIEHWLAANSWPEAATAIERQGMAVVSSSPELMRRWLELLPAQQRQLPGIQALAGQLEWAAGDNEKAIEALREAVDGFQRRPNPAAEWIARSMLVDSLFATGEVEELQAVVEGRDEPAAGGAGGLAPAAAIYAAICLAAYGRFEESDRLAASASRHPDSGFLAPLEALRLAFRDVPRGRLDEVCAGLKAAADELERADPLSRRTHVVGALAAVLVDMGFRERALEMWMRIREDARGGLVPVLADATHAWCALLHAQAGRLPEAESELALHRREETGFRAFIAELAPACVASLRGDAAETLAAASRAVDFVAGGPILFRYWVGADLVPALAAVGRPDRAMGVLEGTLEAVDETLPGSLGRLPRARLLALRAWLRHADGDAAGADDDLRLSWQEAGETQTNILRREWVRLERVAWDALERGALEPQPVVEAIADAFPEGPQLVPLLDHPVGEVRRAAIAPAVRSGNPEALARLTRLTEDPDPALAGVASRAAERLASTLPPLRYELLGGFAVRRGSWHAGEGEWGRPVDARLVRFLLVNVDRPVPEDVIFEALWPGRSASSARRSLQVAISRARRVLDPPGAERSVIESGDHAYRLALTGRDTLDSEEFLAATEAALGEHREERRALLERARSLWGGEPLPEERYSDWATAYREQLIDRYISVLTALIELREGAGEHTDAAAIARELVELDPLNEGGHRALIRAYARAGRTGHALRQYLECRRALVEQLGIEPAEETSRLQARILAGEAV